MLAVLVRAPGLRDAHGQREHGRLVDVRGRRPSRCRWSRRTPPPGFAETNVSPGGSTSLTRTPVAGLGPRLTTTTLKVSVSPTDTVARVAVLRILRFADAAALSVTLALSFVGFGSASTCCVFCGLVDQCAGRVDGGDDDERRRGVRRPARRRSTSAPCSCPATASPTPASAPRAGRR